MNIFVLTPTHVLHHSLYFVGSWEADYVDCSTQQYPLPNGFQLYLANEDHGQEMREREEEDEGIYSLGLVSARLSHLTMFLMEPKVPMYGPSSPSSLSRF